MLLAAHNHHGHQTGGQLQRRGNGLLQPRGNALFHQQAVDDNFDGVILALVDHRQIVERKQFAVDAHAHVAVLRKFFQLFAVRAFSPAHDGRENHYAVVGLAKLAMQDRLHDLFAGLPGDGLAAVRAMRSAHRRVDHAQVIVNFGGGAYRGARRPRGGLLLDGDGWRQPLNDINLGALHLIQELPRIGRQRLHIAALPLRIDGVERQRGLPGAGQPGNHRQRIARYLNVDILEVMLPRAADDQFRQAHVGEWLPPQEPWPPAGNLGPQ